MNADHEVQRLKQVYRSYRESQIIQAQWDETNPGNRAIMHERQQAFKALLSQHGLLPLTERKILDVGCGTGKVLASLLELGAQPENLYGVDLLPDRIAEAKRRYPDFHFLCANAERLDFPDAHFDLVLLFTVFSSILDSNMAKDVTKEIRRVIRTNGAILWYDFRYNNPYNPHVRGMTRKKIRNLFPDMEIDLFSITLLPLLSRRLGRLTPVFYPTLVAVPILRTHYIGLFKCQKL